jgi:protein TonB
MKKYLMTVIIFLAFSFYNYGQNIKNVDTVVGNNEPIFLQVEEPPIFPGGESALTKFLRENINYPKEAIKNKISGTVYVQFIIEKDGSISDIQVVRGIGGGCDEEAVRVIKLLPKWIPAKQNGVEVRAYYILPIQFSLY